MIDLQPSSYRLRLALLLLLAALLGAARLATPPIWLDEASSWYNASGGWHHLWQRAVQGEDTGGILYGALLRLWVGVAGTGEGMLRLPGVLLMVAAVAAIARAARLLYGPSAGILAAASALAHPSLLAAGRQARGYILLLFFASAAILALVERFAGKGRRSGVLLAAASLGAAATHVFGVSLALGAAAVYALLERQAGRPHPVARAVALAAPALVFSTAWAFLMRQSAGSRLNSFWIPGTVLSNYLLIGALLVAPLMAAGGWLLWGDRSPRARSIVVGVGVMALPILAAPGVASLFVAGHAHLVLLRYALALVPLAALAAGCALATCPMRLAVPVVVAALAGSLAYSAAKGVYAPVTLNGQDVRGAAAFLERHAAAEDALFVEPANDWMPLAYYGVGTAPMEGRGAGWRMVTGMAPQGSNGGHTWLVRFSRRTTAPPSLVARASVVGHFGTITILRTSEGR